MTTELATQETNPFLAYGRAASRRTIVGSLLKFSKFGEWTAGQDDVEIDEGTKFVALMDEIMLGWVKWWEGRPVEHEMGRLAEGFQPARRPDLGDNDETQWERDKKGTPRDPWQRTNYLILKAVDSDDLYTFAPSSQGGLTSVGMLSETYGKVMRAKPDQLPIVALESRSYKHKEFGKIFTPMLKVVGWAPKAEAMAALDASESQPDADDDLGDAPF